MVRIAVFGGTGLVGSQVCKLLVACGCSTVSITRSGDNTLGPWSLGGAAKPLLAQFEGEAWVSQVEWIKADAAVDGEALAALQDGVDGVVSCIGSGDMLKATADGWYGRNVWSDFSKEQYAANYEPNANVITAAKAAGAQRFVYVGASSDAEQGFGGPLPGLYSGKRAAYLAGRDAFGDQFTMIAPHLVVGSKDDPRVKFAQSGVAAGLRSVNDFFGEIRNFGEDFTTKTRLAQPVLATDVATAIVASVIGKVAVDESVRFAGPTTPSGGLEQDRGKGADAEVRDLMRHVDGTDAIIALAKRAQEAGVGL